jgi:RimJ/RimL family protein N-acetyltransferase
VTRKAFATERLAIEPLAPAHADGLFAALDDPAVHRYLPQPEVTTLAAVRARIEHLVAGPPRPDERWWNFAVLLRAEPTLIGRVEATTYGDWGEIAYVLGPRWWGAGFATEATRWLVEHLAAHGVTELWAAVHPANSSSQRLLHRVGFAAAAAPQRPLASFDPGDLVFVRRRGARRGDRSRSRSVALAGRKLPPRQRR